jgi:hypothetical protein
MSGREDFGRVGVDRAVVHVSTPGACQHKVPWKRSERKRTRPLRLQRRRPRSAQEFGSGCIQTAAP